MNFFKKYNLHLVLLALGIINLVIFHYLFGFHTNNDTDSFIDTINFFRGNDIPLFFTNRYAVPFYPVVSAKILFFLSPVSSLIVTNIVFYFGLLLLTYSLIARVFNNKWIGFVTALFAITNYAMVRYGLTQVEDMGGYFWCVLTMYSIWRWREQKKYSWLLLSSVSVAFGILTKESGAMGALFAGIVILSEIINWKKTVGYLAMFAALPLFTLIVNSVRGADVGFSSLSYFIETWRIWGANYTLLRWFGVNASTYNLTWAAIFIGVVLLCKNLRMIDRGVWVYFIAVLPTALSYFAWPVFIARTVFISAWLLLPLAAYGLFKLYERISYWKYLSVFSVFILLATPYLLQNTLRYAHVFTIIDSCNKNPVCAWNYFWQSRDAASKIK
ncbi:MAG TPA: glycosyltransferase family 39 protein [Candidatus Udaeobacter sp.]|nr:glycosyltransferase family 39 protein [Candidatus Udaeobacter sp.]